jgi:hypothetical protein
MFGDADTDSQSDVTEQVQGGATPVLHDALHGVCVPATAVCVRVRVHFGLRCLAS